MHLLPSCLSFERSAPTVGLQSEMLVLFTGDLSQLQVMQPAAALQCKHRSSTADVVAREVAGLALRTASWLLSWLLLAPA